MLNLENNIIEKKSDRKLSRVKEILKKGDYEELPITKYLIKGKLSAILGFLLIDDRLVVPEAMRQTMLQLLRAGHIGVA